MKIIRSVRDARGNTFQKQPQGGVGRTRCPKCSNLCIAQRMPDGKEVMACQGCGANYVSQSMDAQVKPGPNALPTRPVR